jgi:hypothetical protein
MTFMVVPEIAPVNVIVPLVGLAVIVSPGLCGWLTVYVYTPSARTRPVIVVPATTFVPAKAIPTAIVPDVVSVTLSCVPPIPPVKLAVCVACAIEPVNDADGTVADGVTV